MNPIQITDIDTLKLTFENREYMILLDEIAHAKWSEDSPHIRITMKSGLSALADNRHWWALCEALR